MCIRDRTTTASSSVSVASGPTVGFRMSEHVCVYDGGTDGSYTEERCYCTDMYFYFLSRGGDIESSSVDEVRSSLCVCVFVILRDSRCRCRRRAGPGGCGGGRMRRRRGRRRRATGRGRRSNADAGETRERRGARWVSVSFSRTNRIESNRIVDAFIHSRRSFIHRLARSTPRANERNGTERGRVIGRRRAGTTSRHAAE